MSHPNSKSKTSLATLFPFSMRDLIVTALILFVAVAFCILLQRLDPSAGFATPVFVLTVLLTSRLTTGYFWGLFSAVLGVIAVNFFFTFPYWAFNLTITGYPLSFLTFLSVSVITSALTTKTRQLDKLRMENERIRMRADLLRSVSHDIRTPLTSIIGSTSAVLDNPDLSQEDRPFPVGGCEAGGPVADPHRGKSPFHHPHRQRPNGTEQAIRAGGGSPGGSRSKSPQAAS